MNIQSNVKNAFAVTENNSAMNFHRYSIAPLTTLQINTTSAERRHHSDATTDVVRIAWLRRFPSTAEQVNSLLGQFSSAGMDVWLVNGENLPLEQILCFDLILLESSSNPSINIQAKLERIRSGSRAPLILLTDEYSVQWGIDALRAGADAILPFDSSSDVILARCRSLLRRWLSV